MPAPTFVAEYESAWSTTTSPKTASVTVAVGDVLVCYVISEDSTSTLGTPTGGTGLTWTLQQSWATASNCDISVYTCTAGSAQTFTLSVANTGTSHRFGFNCLRFSGSTGIGASAKAQSTGAPSVSITTTAANSAIVVASGDWAAIDGASRTARTTAGAFTETTYSTTSGQYTVYGGYHADVSAAGAKTVGWSAPTGQTYSAVAVEVLGTGSAGISGTVSATSSTTGSLTRSSVAGVVAGASAAAGTVDRSTVAGVAAATSSATGTLPASTVSGVVAAVSATAGTLPRSAVAGVATGTSGASGTVAPSAIAGAVVATSSTIGTLTPSSSGLSGTVSAVSGVQGTVARSAASGVVSATSATLGAVARSTVAGTIAATSGASGAVQRSALAGIVAATSDLAGILPRSTISGAAQAVSSTLGALTPGSGSDLRDITVTVTPLTGHPLGATDITGHPLTTSALTSHPLTVTEVIAMQISRNGVEYCTVTFDGLPAGATPQITLDGGDTWTTMTLASESTWRVLIAGPDAPVTAGAVVAPGTGAVAYVRVDDTPERVIRPAGRVMLA